MNLIKYIFLDVDGTLTDGKVYYSSSNEEIKVFDIKDGLILSVFVKCGFHIVVVTGRKSSIVINRMLELGIKEVYQGVKNKKEFLKKYFVEHHISKRETCYIGDDLNDVAAMRLCEFKACPRNACLEVCELADYVSVYTGGRGAIRDIFEKIAKAQNIWENIIKMYE